MIRIACGARENEGKGEGECEDDGDDGDDGDNGDNGDDGGDGATADTNDDEIEVWVEAIFVSACDPFVIVDMRDGSFAAR